MARIAVEDGLTNVEQELRREGFEVTKLTQGTMTRVDAAVITGLSNNFAGDHTTHGNKFPVIEAAGLTAQEIVRQVSTRIGGAH